MKIRRIVAIIVLVAIIGTVTALILSNSSEKAKHGLHVVAAENFWGDIASQLGGSHVQVTSIITDPTADPHLYESNANNAAAVGSADIVVTNGVGYDDFMDKLLGASKNQNRQVLNAATILGVGDDANPHLWYDIPRVHEVAARIAAGYESKDPDHKSNYEANLKSFDRSLQPLLAVIGTIKQKYSGTPVAYTEPVPGYLLNDAGLSVKTPEGFAKSIEDGTDPSPADTTAMESLLTNKTARVLFYNSQATSPVTEHVRKLANQAGIPVIGVTETIPPKQRTYQTWQKDQLDQILKALETK